MSRTADATYRRNRATLKAKRLPCHLCGQPIDYSLEYPHPRSFSADHADPVARGGDNHGELLPAHLDCNKKRGKRRREDVSILKTSRQW